MNRKPPHTIDEHHAWHVKQRKVACRVMFRTPDWTCRIFGLISALEILEETEFLLHFLPDLHFGHASGSYYFS